MQPFNCFIFVLLLQSATEPRVQWLEEQLRGLALSDGPAATGLVLGSLCLGQFSLDNNWCVIKRGTDSCLSHVARPSQLLRAEHMIAA